MYLLKIISIISCFFFNSVYCFSQNFPEKLRAELETNISSYRFKYFTDDNIFCSESIKEEIVDRYFLKKNEEYDLKIFPYNYPYSKRGLNFFIVKNNFFSKNIIGSKTKNKVFFTHSIGFSQIISNVFLIGVDESEKIFYIAGSFFKNCIAKYFNLQVDDPESFEEFLKLKLFNYDLSKLSVEKQKKKYILFQAYSKALKEFVYIKINSKDFDMLQVKTINNNRSEKGSYSWIKNKWD